MGTSEWGYVVPFQPDLNKALQELRQKVFEAGRYYKPADFLEMVIEQDIVDENTRTQLEPGIEELRSKPKPSTIAELMELNGEEGTHSILDIESISDTPSFGTVSPLKEQELIEIFGTTQPAIEIVTNRDNVGRLHDKGDRWEGIYVIAYKDGVPDKIYFTGFSGD